MSVLLLGLLLVTSGLAHGQPLTFIGRINWLETAKKFSGWAERKPPFIRSKQTREPTTSFVISKRMVVVGRLCSNDLTAQFDFGTEIGTSIEMASELPDWLVRWRAFMRANELIHELTNQFDDNSTLRIEIYGDRNPGSQHANDFYFSEYYFRLNDEKSEYEAAIFIDWQHLVGNASTGWYDITYSNGVKFSTIDHNNDPDPDCQQIFHLGGWWTHYCGLISLNGEYTPRKFGDGYGLFFTVAGQFVVNPKTTRMMVRDRETK
ncbi:hypothetical protein M3Y96_00192800 [Aphelenchoides besseyi]|nr:hypothetical protein M3Y96_00192800 [Aphelenchoides besseyi]